MNSLGSIWVAWKGITQFYGSARIAFETEKLVRQSAETIQKLKIVDRESIGKYEIELEDHLEIIGKEELICSVVFLTSYSIFEHFGRFVLGISQDKELTGGVEVWAERILKKGGKSFEDVHGKKVGLVELSSIRNIYAHGNTKVDQSMINRIRNSGAKCTWHLNQEIKMDHPQLQEYRARMRSLMRLGEHA